MLNTINHPFIGSIYRLSFDLNSIHHVNSIFSGYNDSDLHDTKAYEFRAIKQVVCDTYEAINAAIADFKVNRQHEGQQLRILTKMKLLSNENNEVSDPNIKF